MRKILLFSFFLIIGLVWSQTLPTVMGGDYAQLKTVLDTMLYICLAFIMINVGREFEVEKENWRSYINDYFIAMATAALPWMFVAFYYIYALLPSELWSSWDAWKEGLLLSRFAAPTSAGILFTMLAAIGLRASWIYRKIQVLAIFDDLDTIILMIPLQILMVGMKLEMAVIIAVVTVLLVFGWRKLAAFDLRQEWWAIMGYSILVIGTTWVVNHLFHIHIEVLLPAFVLGMVMKHKHINTKLEYRVSTAISFLFMMLVGMSMPFFMDHGMPIAGEDIKHATSSIIGSQPMMSWGTIAIHVIIVSALSNIGKLVPIFFYRDRKFSERMALSIAMFTRGEVGAGIIFIAIGYNIGGPALIISVLTIVLNLILTGFFVVWVKKLALRSYTPQQS